MNMEIDKSSLEKHKAKTIGAISGPCEEIITPELNKAECFSAFLVNISEDLNNQQDLLDVSSLNIFNWLDKASK